MPYQLRFNKLYGWRLWNLHKKEYAVRSFRTRKAAINSAKAYIAYRERKPSRLVGDKILPD